VLSQITGIEHVFSVTRPGLAILTIQFKVGEDRIASLVRLHDTLQANATVCVNVVAGAQKDAAMVFAGVTKCTMEERFDAGSWTTVTTGAPVLEGALVAFDCRVTGIVEKGTHLVVFAEVEGIRQGGEAAGLVYFGRDYHEVTPRAAG
jgi:flavin reductase